MTKKQAHHQRCFSCNEFHTLSTKTWLFT